MSCGCSTPTGCNPCTSALTSEESVASQLANLTYSLFGQVTKTVVNGRAVWTAPCDAETGGLACNPRLDDEGFICYITRLLGDIGIFYAGVYDANLTYCANSLVVHNDIGYVSLQNVPINTAPNVSPLYWQKMLEGVQGPQGNQGPPGAPGSGVPGNFAIRTITGDESITGADDVIFCETMAAQIAITIPEMSTLLSGKFFQFWTDGSEDVVLTPSGADTINGAATYTIPSIANVSVELQANGDGDWKIV